MQWFRFRSGQNITADNLNAGLQDFAILNTRIHSHIESPFGSQNYLASKNSPMIWGDFIYIGDVAARVNILNQSLRDHVMDSSIHHGEGGADSTTINTENRMYFQLLRADKWEWKGEYWEQIVNIPPGLYENCNYLVNFQPHYAGTYVEYMTALNPMGNYYTLQGVVPLNNRLLDYNIMAHSLEDDKFVVRLYAIGRGTRYGIVGRSEEVFMSSGWNFQGYHDATLKSPGGLQAIDNRLYVLSKNSNKIVVFDNTNGGMLKVIPSPEAGASIRSFAVARDVSVEAEGTSIGDPFNRVTVGNFAHKGYSLTVTVESHDGFRRAYLIEEDDTISLVQDREDYEFSNDYSVATIQTYTGGGQALYVYGRLGLNVSGGSFQNVLKVGPFSSWQRNLRGEISTWGGQPLYTSGYYGSWSPEYGPVRLPGYRYTGIYSDSEGISLIGSVGSYFIPTTDTFFEDGYPDYDTQAGVSILGQNSVIVDAHAPTKSFVATANVPGGTSNKMVFGGFTGQAGGEAIIDLPGRPIAISGFNTELTYGGYSELSYYFVLYQNSDNTYDIAVYRGWNLNESSSYVQQWDLQMDGDDPDRLDLNSGDPVINTGGILAAVLNEVGPGFKPTDIEIGLTPDDPDTLNTTYRIVVYVSEETTNKVYAIISEETIDIDFSSGTSDGSVYITSWNFDSDINGTGIFLGTQAMFGKHATFEGDREVISEGFINPSSPNEDWNDAKDGIYNAYASNLYFWPGDMNRGSRYSLIGPGLIENGDYFKGLLDSNNPIADMSFMCYTRPITYQGRESVGDAFTLNPYGLKQVMVHPHTDPTQAENRPYLAYTPQVISNAASLVQNNINTYCNTTFMLNDDSVTHIDIDFDMGLQVKFLSRTAYDSNPTQHNEIFTVDNIWNMTVSESSSETHTLTQFNSLVDYTEDVDGQFINLDLRNLLIGVLHPPQNDSGWNWTVLGPKSMDTFTQTRGMSGGPSSSTSANLHPVNNPSEPNWIKISNAGILSESELETAGYSSEDIILRLTLELQSELLSYIPGVCNEHGLESGIPFPFEMTLHDFWVDNLRAVPYRGVAEIGGMSGSAVIGSLGEFVADDPCSVAANSATLNTLPTRINMVNLFNAPLSRGGLWISILSPPFALLPKYASRHVFEPEDTLYLNAGSAPPFMHSDINSSDVFRSIGSRLVYAINGGSHSKATRYVALNSFSYYRNLRSIKFRREA